MSEWPSWRNAALEPRPCGWIISRPRYMKFSIPCCTRSASMGKPERSARMVATIGMSPKVSWPATPPEVDMPIQSVAQ